MYTYGEPNAQNRIEQHGDFVLIKKDWCPQLAKITSTVCKTAYTPTEMQVSFTNAGHLTPDVVLIPAGLPAAERASARIAHKTGEISMATHDAGIVFLEGRAPYVLAVLTGASGSPEERYAPIARISELVFEVMRG